MDENRETQLIDLMINLVNQVDNKIDASNQKSNVTVAMLLESHGNMMQRIKEQEERIKRLEEYIRELKNVEK